MIFSLRSMDSLVYSFWSLLPSFCNYPLDTAESFKDLQKALCIALNEEPDVRGIICSSLQILIQQNKRVLEGKNDESDLEVDMARKLAMSRYTQKVAETNLTVLKSSSPELLSALSDIFLKSTKDDGYLQACLYWLKNENLCFCDRLTLLLVRLLQLLVHKHIVVVTASCLVYVCTSSISFNDFCFFYVLEFFCFVWARVFCIFYIFQY